MLGAIAIGVAGIVGMLLWFLYVPDGSKGEGGDGGGKVRDPLPEPKLPPQTGKMPEEDEKVLVEIRF